MLRDVRLCGHFYPTVTGYIPEAHRVRDAVNAPTLSHASLLSHSETIRAHDRCRGQTRHLKSGLARANLQALAQRRGLLKQSTYTNICHHKLRSGRLRGVGVAVANEGPTAAPCAHLHEHVAPVALCSLVFTSSTSEHAAFR